MTKILFEYSPWLLIPAAGIGFLFAWLLYSKKGPWPENVHKLLFGLRVFVFTLIAFLLLGPLLRQIENYFEKPEIIIAWDNSLSVNAGTDSLALNSLKERLVSDANAWRENGFDVNIQTFDGEKNAFEGFPDFTSRQTNLHEQLKKIEEQSQGKNLRQVLLISDGINNAGLNPSFQLYGLNLSTVGLGDTIPKKDVFISSLRFNKISYKGSLFPIVAEVAQNGYSGVFIQVKVIKGGQTIASQIVFLDAGENFKSVEFLIEAQGEGLQTYQIAIDPVEGEFTTENNQKSAFVEVIEAKQQILLVAAAPHPDIKALRSVLDQNESYELTIHIHGIDDWNYSTEFDLAILHQMPSRIGDANSLLDRIPSTTPKWFILGSQTDLNLFSQMNGLMELRRNSPQPDRVFPAYSPNYDRFIFETEQRDFLRNLPPVAVPFGEYKIYPNAEIMLFQRVGNVLTDRPLLMTGMVGDAKTAVMIGEGLWNWRLDNIKREGKEFDQLFSKLIQYLAAREDNRKFRFYPIKNEWDEGETIIFESEGYNDILEKIYNYQVDIRLRNEADSVMEYTYEPTASSARYRVSGLKSGIYRYEGRTSLQGNTEVDRGEFLVTRREVELSNLTANHGLMRTMANNHGGKYYDINEIDALSADFKNLDTTQRIISEEAFLPANRLLWLFLLLVLIAGTEWFLRKYYGSY
jgi:hypothetical protein